MPVPLPPLPVPLPVVPLPPVAALLTGTLEVGGAAEDEAPRTGDELLETTATAVVVEATDATEVVPVP